MLKSYIAYKKLMVNFCNDNIIISCKMCSKDSYLCRHQDLGNPVFCKKWVDPNICEIFAKSFKMRMPKNPNFALNQKGCLYPNESLILKTGGSFLMFLVNRLCKSSGIRGSQRLENAVLSRWSHPNLVRIFLTPERCIQQIIKYIQFMFVRDELELGFLIDYLNQFFENFSRTQHIEAIDMIAILNSMRTTHFSFEFASLKWHLCFSEKTRIIYGQGRVIIEVESKVLTKQITAMYQTLKPREQDLVGFMHLGFCERLKNRLYPESSFGRFEVTVDRPYNYWNRRVGWDYEDEYGKCRQVLSCFESSLVRYPRFDKKRLKWFRFTPTSLENFFKELFNLRNHCMPGFEKEMKDLQIQACTWNFWELREVFDV